MDSHTTYKNFRFFDSQFMDPVLEQEYREDQLLKSRIFHFPVCRNLQDVIRL